jgi:uncharacterized protein GlcG (DUF336 family)
MNKLNFAATAILVRCVVMSLALIAQDQATNPGVSCPVDHDHLADILKKSVKPGGGPSNGGLDNNEWAAVVNRDGIVCAVAFSGNKVDDQWPGSRAIAAEKANTANAFSLKNKAMATANLYAKRNPAESCSVRPEQPTLAGRALCRQASEDFGTRSDPMVGKPLGGVIVFGGGLALYDGQRDRRSARRQRRQFLRGSQRRLARAPPARARPCAGRRQSQHEGCHHLRHRSGRQKPVRIWPSESATAGKTRSRSTSAPVYPAMS